MFRKVAGFALFASLGPITGPLIYGAVSSYRRGRRVMASFYLAAAIEALGALSMVAASVPTWHGSLERDAGPVVRHALTSAMVSGCRAAPPVCPWKPHKRHH